MMTAFKNFSAYWPDYLREHSRPLTRICHYLQTVLGGLALLAILDFQAWIYLLALLPAIFIFALCVHLFIEGNKPAAADHPFWWSVLNDMRMLFHMVTGTLSKELEKAGVERSWV